MTVCVGAACQGGKAVVVAADRMITFGPPMMLNTEPVAFTKIKTITDRVVALFAGSVPEAEDILSRARLYASNSSGDIPAIAEAVRAAYADLKARRAEETILAPCLGTNFAGFQQMVTQSSSSQLLQQILGLLVQHNLGTDVLVAGIDASGAHLYMVTHPGQLQLVGPLGYAAIGSGGVHAAVRISLARHTDSASLVDTIYNVYEAKRAAEISPGVGTMTDMAVLRDGKLYPVPEKTLTLLGEFHKERPELSPEESDRLKGVCDEIFS